MTSISGEDTPRKKRKLATRACDACRARRRRCIFSPESDDIHSVCVRCSQLELRCTFDVPARSRGPKRKSPPTRALSNVDLPDALDGERSESEVIGQVDPSDHEPGKATDAVLNVAFPTDQICPRDLFLVIMEDYIAQIHHLIPVVHLPTFRTELATNQDVNDPVFLSLTIALVALVVSVLPSRFPTYQAMIPPAGRHFATRSDMAEHCWTVCLRLRSVRYWDQISQRKWAISYALCMSAFQLGQNNQGRMFEAEAMQTARLLGVHLVSEYTGLNPVETQLRKKAFWLQFFGFVHSKVQPGRHSHIVFLDAHALGAVEFDALVPENKLDEDINATPSQTSSARPAGKSPIAIFRGEAPAGYHFNMVTTFILLTRVFFTALRESLSFVGDGVSPGGVRPPEQRLERLQALQHDLQYLLDDLHPGFRQWETGSNSVDSSAAPRVELGIAHANLHVSHLWLQSHVLDNIDTVLEELGSSQANLIAASWKNREEICRQLLHLLHQTPKTYLEPNGNFLIYKVRAVATSLLTCPFPPDSLMSRRAFQYVEEFTQLLAQLDQSEVVNTDALQSWVDGDRQAAP